MNEEEFAALAAGNALHALSSEDRARFEDALAQHPEWQSWVDADEATAAALAEGVRDVVPPAALRNELLARIAVAPQRSTDAGAGGEADDVVVPPRPPAPAPVAPVEPAPDTALIQAVSRRNWTRGIFALAACLVLLVALGFASVSINEYLTRTPAAIALADIESAPDAQAASVDVPDGGTATAHWSEELGKAVLVSDGLPVISDDQSFELWFVRDDGAVSAGVFETVAGADATVLLDGALEAGDVIAVTVEPEGGAPDGQPTSDPIIAIPTA
jgi:anti-sigma-K factor RskA